MKVSLSFPNRLAAWYSYISERGGLYLVLLSTEAAILFTIAAGDKLLSSWRPAPIPKHVWALVDAPVHALLGLLVTSPLWARRASPRRTLLRFTLAGAASTLVDLDHFAAAGSLSLYAATHLSYRPATHSLLFALACALPARILSRDPGSAALVFTALASHLLRDAASGGTHFLLWPFHFERLSYPAYLLSQTGLFLATWASARWLDRGR